MASPLYGRDEDSDGSTDTTLTGPVAVYALITSFDEHTQVNLRVADLTDGANGCITIRS